MDFASGHFVGNLTPDPGCLSASCEIQGRVLEYKLHNRKSVVIGGGLRGAITTFSDAARLRMSKHLSKIDYQNHPSPLFLTLTYPDELAAPSLAQRNIHRKVMARHLERITGAVLPAAWRVEWVTRKSGSRRGECCPHWHWLIFKTRYIDYREINLAWRKTIGCDGYVRTEISRVRDFGGVQMYICKYISKEACPLSLVMERISEQIGRSYGWLRKNDIPMAVLHAHRRLSEGDRNALMAFASERLPQVSEGLEQSFTLFGPAVQDAQKILTGESLDT